MDNQVIQQILSTQTQMLQHITTLQQQQATSNMNVMQSNANQQSATGAYGTPMPGNIASPVTPPPPVSVADPTQYGTYATPYGSYTDGGRIPVGSTFNPRNFIGSSINEAMSFNPAGQSIEASSNYMYQQSQGVQMGVVNAMGGALKGGTNVGSLFIPGLVPSLIGGGVASLAVGGMANAMIGGARNALDYQTILQQKGPQFISAFNSTNDMGGIGWSLKDQQQASRFLRELAPQEFMNNSDMQKVLSGAADNGLMNTVTDVKDFQKKFKDIVGAVKDITVTMNQTIDQATQFMGQMKQMGITTKDMPLTAAQIKVMSSSLGVSSDVGTQIALGGAQQLAQGTGMSTSGAVRNTAETTYYAQNLWNNLPDNSSTKNWINNNGGAAQVGMNFNQSINGFIESQAGQSLTAGLFGSAASIDSNGNVSIDKSKLKGILNGSQDVNQLTKASMGNISKLNPGQQVEMLGKLNEEFTNMAGEDSSTLPAVAQRIAQAYQQQAARSGTKMDMQTALVQSGLAPDYNTAQVWEKMINQSMDPGLKAQFDARSLKQSQDAHAIANSPSLLAKGKYWFEENIAAPFGNVGQDVSDSVGQADLAYQKWLTGMSDRSTVNAQSLQDFSQKGLEKEFGQLKNVDALNKGTKSSDIVNQLKTGKTKGDNQIGSDTYGLYMSEASKGQMDPATIAKINNMDHLNLLDQTRRMMINEQTSGHYDGFFGKVNWGLDEAGYGIESGVAAVGKGAEWLGQGAWNGAKWLLNIDQKNPYQTPKEINYDVLQKQGKDLEGEKKKLNQDTASLFASKDIRGMKESDLQSLQQGILSGNIDQVKSLTSNKQAIDLANKAKKLNSSDTQYSSAMDEYTNVSQYTKAIANSGNLMGDTLSAAGFSASSINDLVGSLRDQGKKVSKDLKGNKLTLSDMASNDREMLKKYDMMFGSMTEYDKEKLTTYLENQNKDFNVKSVLGSDGKSIDSSKLEKYMLGQIKNENLSNSKSSSKNKTASEGDVVKASKDHTQAMYTMLTTLQQETQMMNDVSNGAPVSNYSSSIGTR